jgi:hypothetical protein
MNYLLTSNIFRQSLAISVILFLVLTQLPTMRQNVAQAFMPTNARAFLLTFAHFQLDPPEYDEISNQRTRRGVFLNQ